MKQKRNRERIMAQSLYDLLCSMNDNLNHNDTCIMDALKAYTGDRCKQYGSGKECGKCIADWLNEFPF